MLTGIANALGIFTPAITLIIYAVVATAHGQALDTETAFTTMAILGLVTHPANMVMTIVPRAIGSLAGFDRIQSFLLRPSLHDQREELPRSVGLNLVDIEDEPPAILIQDLKLGVKQTILESININISKGSLTIISGPVGSGKTTLLRAVLGEAPLTDGTIKISSQRIAYCAQRPWLPRGSLRRVITNTDSLEDIDISWYQKVLAVCCLEQDFKSLPEKDQTQIGSRGMNLSGGQRQRVVSFRRSNYT